MKQSLRKLYKKFRKLILYAVFGIVSTGLEFGIFSILLQSMSYQWANVIGFHAGIISSFFLNRKYNFKVKDNPVSRFLVFYGIQLIGLLISSLVLMFFIENLGWDKLVAKALSILIVALLLFELNNLITFRRKR
ncbi:MAG: GtrA family protein [bacterium]|nr:GtrA family protein [Candidatus Limimorpha equi]